jgi:hypothetical protein
VRWSKGLSFGVEFIFFDTAERQRLERYLSQIISWLHLIVNAITPLSAHFQRFGLANSTMPAIVYSLMGFMAYES